jgi:hypothetical protein
MRMQISLLIALLAMSSVVLASIETTLTFEGDGVLYSGTRTLNDNSRLEASSNGPVSLEQSTYMAGTQRQSQMQLNSGYGRAFIKTPEYNLRVKGYDFETAASLFRTTAETGSSLFPELKNDKDLSIDLNKKEGTRSPIETILTTKLDASVFVKAKAGNGSVNREIAVSNNGKWTSSIGDITFKGRFNFTDRLDLSDIVIQKEYWQNVMITPVGASEEL